MKRIVAVASVVTLLFAASLAQAADVSFNINVGGPPIAVAQAPDFLYPAELGYGVAVGVPYDMFYLSGVYYLYRGGGWYRTSYYGGSWIRVRHRDLPPDLRRYNITRIHELRDREFRFYARDRDHYRGRYFRPEGRGREERREVRTPVREERQDLREQRRDERRDGLRDERREEHREEKRDR